MESPNLLNGSSLLTDGFLVRRIIFRGPIKKSGRVTPGAFKPTPSDLEEGLGISMNLLQSDLGEVTSYLQGWKVHLKRQTLPGYAAVDPNLDAFTQKNETQKYYFGVTASVTESEPFGNSHLLVSQTDQEHLCPDEETGRKILAQNATENFAIGKGAFPEGDN